MVCAAPVRTIDMIQVALDDFASNAKAPAVLGVRLPISARQALKALASEAGPGINEGDVARAAIRYFLEARLRELRAAAQTEAIAEKAREMLAQLPPGELDISDQVSFSMKDNELLIHSMRTGVNYVTWSDPTGSAYVVRIRTLQDGQSQLTFFRDGLEVERGSVVDGFGKAQYTAEEAASLSPSELRAMIDEELAKE